MDKWNDTVGKAEAWGRPSTDRGPGAEASQARAGDCAQQEVVYP